MNTSTAAVPATPMNLAAAKALRDKQLPPFVIAGFNEQLLANVGTTQPLRARFTQNAVIESIIKHAAHAGVEVTRQDCFSNHWLDVEDVFAAVGVKVKYDSPSIGDSFEAYFVFTDA
ncbi:hypothetical protein D3C71_25560 [compost metagenome]